VLDYANQMIAAVQQELMLVLADPHLAALGENVRIASKNGVAVSALLTGEGELDCGQIARHPPLESELQELTGLLVVVVDDRECLIANSDPEMTATVTTNRDLVLIARQFVWMELFAQRIYTHLSQELLHELEPEDRRIFESIANHIG
jgi:Cd2+/Zn2+-exporting ATPase